MACMALAGDRSGGGLCVCADSPGGSGRGAGKGGASRGRVGGGWRGNRSRSACSSASRRNGTSTGSTPAMRGCRRRSRWNCRRASSPASRMAAAAIVPPAGGHCRLRLHRQRDADGRGHSARGPARRNGVRDPREGGMAQLWQCLPAGSRGAEREARRRSSPACAGQRGALPRVGCADAADGEGVDRGRPFAQRDRDRRDPAGRAPTPNSQSRLRGRRRRRRSSSSRRRRTLCSPTSRP